MNAKDVARFDELHERFKRGDFLTGAEAVELRTLKERVVLGADGRSEFPTGPTAIETELVERNEDERRGEELRVRSRGWLNGAVDLLARFFSGLLGGGK